MTLGIEGLHLFTFNNVEATAEWQRKQLAEAQLITPRRRVGSLMSWAPPLHDELRR